MKTKLGISGGLAARFQDNALTPLLAVAAMLLGVFAVIVTPREEEPQIDVTFANVFVGFPGASTTEVENLVALPMEQVLAEIDGVKHVYSVSRPGMGVLTVQFKVGEPRTEALVRLYNAIFSNQDWRPQNLGILPPIVKPKGIDDVPIVSATLWTEDTGRATQELKKVAHALEAEIKRVPGTRDVYTIGGSQEIVHVELDPQRVAGFGMTLDDLRQALTASNVVSHAGSLVYDNSEVPVQAGTFLSDREDVARLVVGMFEGHVVCDRACGWRDRHRFRRVCARGNDRHRQEAGHQRDQHRGRRGRTAGAAGSYADSRRRERHDNPQLRENGGRQGVETHPEALVRNPVGHPSDLVCTTLAATLFASWAWGFTINRVSLFALIFAIGILVDDAIVVVENIHRHRGLGPGTIGEIIPPAVDEVGGPTILATFTVIAALLPMAFVTGLMGPYMSPIPINASTGMLISLAVALILTPWLSHRLLQHSPIHKESGEESKLHRTFERLMRPFLDRETGRRARGWLYGGTVAIIGVAMLLVVRWLSTCRREPVSSRQPVCSMRWPNQSSACRKSPTTRYMRERRHRSISTDSCASTTCEMTAMRVTSRSTWSTSITANVRVMKLPAAFAANWPRSVASSAHRSRSPKCLRARR
jgi:multidrug efflux pump subunit AcrB